MKKLTIWYRAIFLDYWYWRVKFEDGKKSYLLSYGEAKSIHRFKGGKLYIDYKTLIEFGI